MRRIKLPQSSRSEFADGELGRGRFYEWAEGGTYPSLLGLRSRGCSESALLRQEVEVLRDYGYSVALVSPLTTSPRMSQSWPMSSGE